MTRLTLVLFCPAFFAFWLITSFFSSWSKWWQRCCFSQLVQLTKIFVDFETSKVSRVVTSLPIFNLQRLFPTSKVARVVTSLPSGVVSSNSAPSWNQPLNKGFNKWWEKEKKTIIKVCLMKMMNNIAGSFIRGRSELVFCHSIAILSLFFISNKMMEKSPWTLFLPTSAS